MDPTERDELIVAYRSAAERAATNFARKHNLLDSDEAIGEALLCLVGVAADYNAPTVGGNFPAFLVQRINWRLIDWLRKQHGRGVYPKHVGLSLDLGNDDEIDRPLPDKRDNIEQSLIQNAGFDQVRRFVYGSPAYRFLTPRERDLMKLLLSGLTKRQAADKMGIHESHCSQLFTSAAFKIKNRLILRKRAKPQPRKVGPVHNATCEWCGDSFQYHSVLLPNGNPRYPRRFCKRSCISASIHEFDGPAKRKLPMNPETLRKLYVDQKLTTTQIAKKFGCATHKTVCRALVKHGIPLRRAGRISDGKCKVCGGPALRKKNGAASARLCRKHQTEYQTNWARRRAAGDPDVGHRPLGRKPKLTACKKCGFECDGARAAEAHCPKDPTRQAWVKRGWESRRLKAKG